MFEPTVGTLAVTTTPVEVADTVGDVARSRVVRSAWSERGWWTGGIAGLVEEATAGLESTALWSVIEITDFALRHGRKGVPALSGQMSLGVIRPLRQAQKAQEHLVSKDPGLEKRLSYSESDSGGATPRPNVCTTKWF